jgi:hypothetical protein
MINSEGRHFYGDKGRKIQALCGCQDLWSSDWELSY